MIMACSKGLQEAHLHLSRVCACAGCFGAKAAALKATAVESSGPAAGKYAAKVGKAAQIPVSVTTLSSMTGA